MDYNKHMQFVFLAWYLMYVDNRLSVDAANI